MSSLLRYLLYIPLLAYCSPAGDSVVLSAQNALSQEVSIPPLPSEISFAGESVPLDYFDVKEALMREITTIAFWHGSMTRIIQLDNRYGSAIKRILKEQDVPLDFYYLCIAESSLQPVVSPAGAEGYWQFLKGTAMEYGLVVDDEVDERYHIERSTEAACSYFKKAKEMFGTWTMAAASFNIGINNVQYRMRIQKQTNYYDTQFPEETSRYLFRALAFKTILSAPELYGFKIDDVFLYKPLKYKEVKVAGRIENWSDFAASHNTNFKILKIFNPWIRANYLYNKKGRSFIVKVPEKGFREE